MGKLGEPYDPKKSANYRAYSTHTAVSAWLNPVGSSEYTPIGTIIPPSAAILNSWGTL